MSDVRILAVSFESGDRPEHITYVWTAGGATPRQRAVEDLWRGRCRYYVVTTKGRVDVAPVPLRGPNILSSLLGKRVDGHLSSPARSSAGLDSLLTLPRLPSPARPRRSQAAQLTV